ncbi:alpha/beta hydrolase [Pseudoxanthomonas putridarboris]|uniref:Alpha/beta hydrolase n=1 Tax=Pseudoxanthomonas putridarboris TaxID=752605 RepID=A0ABU9J4M5_9GAMM
MYPFRLRTLDAVFLLALSSSLFASSSERPSIGSSVDAQPHPGGTLDSSPAPTYSQEVPLWPEDSKVLQDGIRELANEEWANTHPTFLLYYPQAPSARSAVIVFPGGGYKALAIGQKSTIGVNGADVCKWLTDSGVTCVLLKYRVPNTGCNWNREAHRHVAPDIPMALQDAQRAISIVRHNANEYGIDPDKIGVMGFSAGGNMAVLSSTAFKERSYDPVDEIDQVSSRPDFAIPVYPGHMTMEHKNKTPREIAAQELNTDIVVSAEVPPTLLVHAKDDPVDPVHFSEVYERELKKAGVNVKLIIYETGGHAFGVRKQGTDTDRWMDDAIEWLREIKIL